jgi:hypothetical protein
VDGPTKADLVSLAALPPGSISPELAVRMVLVGVALEVELLRQLRGSPLPAEVVARLDGEALDKAGALLRRRRARRRG